METSNHVALSRFLARLQLNSTLSASEQRAIMGLKSQVAQVASGRDFVRVGETITQSTLVATGLVGRFDLMRNGARQITAIYMTGDMCDLYSVVAPKSGWGLTALGTCTVLHVAHADLRDLAFRFPNIALAFWRDTVLDASILSKWIANFGRKDARARLAHLFCELGTRMERAKLGRRDNYHLTMTQGHFADATGLTSVHVNRTLQSLRAEGVITVKGQRVAIDDWDRLVSYAEFSPTYLLCGEMASQRMTFNDG